MEMTIGELIDRLTIELRKRTYGFGSQELVQAIREDLVKRFGPGVSGLVWASCHLGILNDAIAVLESGIRNNCDMPLEEVGRRAREIRDLNNQRVAAKNALSKLFGEPESPLYYGAP